MTPHFLWSAEKQTDRAGYAFICNIFDLHTYWQLYPRVYIHTSTQHSVQYECVYSRDWVCGSIAASVCDAVKVVTWGLEQRGERRTTSAAGLQWLAWSSAGPVTHTYTYVSIWTVTQFCLCIQPQWR